LRVKDDFFERKIFYAELNFSLGKVPVPLSAGGKQKFTGCLIRCLDIGNTVCLKAGGKIRAGHFRKVSAQAETGYISAGMNGKVPENLGCVFIEVGH